MRQRTVMTLLGASSAGSLAAAAATVLVLRPEDRISICRGAALTALGLVFFPCLFLLINACALRTAAGARLRRKYALSCGDVMDISNKAVSGVQAVLSCVTGAVVCVHSCRRDLLRTSHYMSEAYAWFGAAYFFYDIWSMYRVFVVQRRETRGPAGVLQYCRHEPVILAHHLFIGGFGFWVIVHLRGGLGDCVFGFAYLMELSTPFVSLRGILSRLRLKRSPAYLANGLAMLVTFFLCRVVSLPYACLLYSRVVRLPYFEAIRSLPTGCKLSICVLLLPQLYWFYLMSAGALKVFAGRGARPLAAGDAGRGGHAPPPRPAHDKRS